MIRRSKKFKAHDENNQCRIGDIVKIMETRPLSRDKQWRVVEVVEATKGL
jgi:small subunit ribosomal protein S17